MFCSNLLQTKSGWGIPCFSARLYQFPDVPVVCLGYDCTTDRHQLLTHVYLTFIWHRFSFPTQTSMFPSGFRWRWVQLLHPWLRQLEKEPRFSARQELQGDLEACGDVAPAPVWGCRGRTSSGWRGCVGAAGAHRGALQGGHLQLCVAEDDGPWGSRGRWEWSVVSNNSRLCPALFVSYVT